MNIPPPTPSLRLRRGCKGRHAFSLAEVAIAIGITAFAFLSIFGLMQVGIVSLRESVDDSVTSLMLNDIRSKLDGMPFPSDAALANQVQTTLPPMYYDRSGQALKVDSAGTLSGASYRVDVILGAPGVSLPDARVAVVCATISWPPDPTTGSLLANARSQKLSFLVTPATDRGWSAASPSYQPRINR